MKIIDISLTVDSNVLFWPTDPRVILERVEKIEDGAIANVSRLDMGVHTATHLDAPNHFVSDGKTIDQLPLDIFVGLAQVLQIPESCSNISAALLEGMGIRPGIERVLFKTSNSRIWSDSSGEFPSSYVGVMPDAAELLIRHGIKLVGIDFLSIAPFDDVITTHQVLLRSKVIILEGLDLSGVSPGIYTLFCPPLKLGGSDGAPTRALLIED